MTINYNPLVFGYWPSKVLNGEIPQAIQNPDEYDGGSVLNIACTQTNLPKTKQDKLVDEWCSLLPTLPVKVLMFSSKVPQRLFNAACHVPKIEALSIKWSSCTNIDALADAASLGSLFLGSSPSVERLDVLAKLGSMKHLFIENVSSPVDISFARSMGGLKEFGLSASRGKRISVQSLEPLSALEHIEMLWLVSVNIINGGLRPLHSLNNLTSLRSTIKHTSPEFRELCLALPTLKYFQPVG